jgi:hypothetical protein
MNTAITIQNDLQLTEEQYLTIEQLAGVNYGPKEIAMYLSLDLAKFLMACQNPDHKINYHYARGVLVAQFEVDNKLLDNAKSGNITATQEYKKASDKKKFDNHKRRILNE